MNACGDAFGHLEVDRVLGLRPVDGDDGDAVGEFGGDMDLKALTRGERPGTRWTGK
ncbi:hypothetical protein GIY30_24105 [Gordonia sp. HNM0687]|uniref:Uncharacterized protein n=1 Tax=Gordonia mangrovi TaxID=2665643 RepID=A0A6L7GWN3_9ACTN|nr:hypothetical protein [Gordonia mangrovi]MXP24409.1 hypothetical protein [Gordonia mangrovi]UVF76865.1 hypothetical protein NWF22_16140 [Gordonia mangrovi]